MKDINLLQLSITEQRQNDLGQYKKIATVTVVLFVVLLAMGYVGMRIGGTIYTKQTETLRAEAATYSAVTDAKTAINTKKSHIANLQQILKIASGTSHVDTNFLWTLSSVLNNHTFFTSVAINENGIVNISGKAATRDDITYFMYLLKKTMLYADVSVSMVNTEKRETAGLADMYDFTVNATLKEGADGE